MLGSCAPAKQLAGGRYLSQCVSLQVYPQENLESILFRLKEDNGIPIMYSTYMLIGYLAVRKNYREVRLDSVLSDQLRPTPFSYRLDKKQITIYRRLP